MSEAAPSSAAHACEFVRLARYLVGAHATPYQIETYLRLRRRRPLAPKNGFDRLLDRLAGSGGVGLALADAYSGFFARKSVVRAKLIATLAVLECSPPSSVTLDAPGTRGPLAFVSLALRAWAVAIALLTATIALAPAHAWLALTGRTKP
jgi:hypothetical protein